MQEMGPQGPKHYYIQAQVLVEKSCKILCIPPFPS